MNLNTTVAEASIAVGLILLALLLLTLAIRAAVGWTRKHEVRGDDALTVLAALVAAMFGAQGMWGFLRATLLLPTTLAVLGFTLFELTMLVCALRARRNLLADSSAGPEGAMLWLFAGLAGFFSATHARSWAEALFRLLVPSIAAWLWHRLMRLEHRKLTGKLSGIHWRITPERILVWLRLAEPTVRSTQQVSATRALQALAIAVERARSPLFGRIGGPSRRRLRRAMRRAVHDAELDTDPAAQRKLTAILGVLGGADTLIELRPTAPWVAVDDDQIGRARRLVEDHGVEVDERTRILLGLPATSLPQPRPGRLPSMFIPMQPFAAAPANGAPANRDPNQPNPPVVAGQDGRPDVRATVAATIKTINDQKIGEQVIADELGVKRNWVRKLLGRDSQPASTAINGHTTRQ